MGTKTGNQGNERVTWSTSDRLDPRRKTNTSKPWITKGIAKASKKKQKLNEKYLKNRNPQNLATYKTYKNLFETIKRKSKKNYYSEKILSFKGDAKKTWKTMKELIGKAKMNESLLPQKIRVKKTDIFDQEKIATEFNRFFANVGPMLAKQIPESKNTFESYLVKTSAKMQHKSVSINELRDAFFSLKLNKSPGYDKISFNVVKKCFSELCKPLKHVFNLSVETGVFPDKLKIAHLSPVYKAGDSSDITNYRPISVFPCFSKIFERIMNIIVYSPMCPNKKKYIQNNSVFNLVIQQSMLFYN